MNIILSRKHSSIWKIASWIPIYRRNKTDGCYYWQRCTQVRTEIVHYTIRIVYIHFDLVIRTTTKLMRYIEVTVFNRKVVQNMECHKRPGKSNRGSTLNSKWATDEYCQWFRIQGLHGPLARYVKLRVAHAPGMPGTFSPPPRVSDPGMYHGTCVTHVP